MKRSTFGVKLQRHYILGIMFIVGWKQGTNSGAVFKADAIEDFLGF